MTANHPLATVMHRCAEVRQSWADRPENQRPPVHDRPASDTWWQRWFTSPEKAHCDQILRAAGFPSQNHQNARHGHLNAK
jgi:hypothetical protein